jgi:hypothetical protein
VLANTTRDLLSGANFEIQPAGLHEMKGITGAREVFRVAPAAH